MMERGSSNAHVTTPARSIDTRQLTDVVAFMKALSGEGKKLDELVPKLPPGSDGKTPDPRLALTPPAKMVASITFHPAGGR
jgi:hypothetical protein